MDETTPPPRRTRFNPPGLVLGLGTAPGVSNGPAAGLAIGAGVGLVFSLTPGRGD